MGMYTYLTLAIAAVASAGTLHGCAGKCIGEAIAASQCASSNSHCICSSDVFMPTVGSCVRKSCAPEEHAAAVSFAEDFCTTVSNTELKRDLEERGNMEHHKAWKAHGFHTQAQWEKHLEHKEDLLEKEKEYLDSEKKRLHAECERLYKLLKLHPNNEALKAAYKKVRAQEKELADALEHWQQKDNHIDHAEIRHGMDPSDPYQSPPEHGHHPTPPPPTKPHQYPPPPPAHTPADPPAPSYPDPPAHHYPDPPSHQHPGQYHHHPGHYPQPSPTVISYP